MPSSEVRHKHPYHEYYVILEGEAQLEVNGQIILMKAGMVVMVEPEEWHQIASISDAGARWVIIKQRSEPGSKIVENKSDLDG